MTTPILFEKCPRHSTIGIKGDMSMFISAREKLYIEVVSGGVRGMAGRLSGNVKEVADAAHIIGLQALRNYDFEFGKKKRPVKEKK
jgi:hypothetical protein